jgi:hypothetical protein
MSTWKNIAIVNAGGLAGITISLFIVSPQTPLWLFAALSAAVLVGLNYFCFRRQTASGERKTKDRKHARNSLRLHSAAVGIALSVLA